MSTGRILLLLTLPLHLLNAQVDCGKCHTEPEFQKLGKVAGLNEKAVGVMDKGQIQNNTGNFGLFSDFHTWFTNAAHWPRTADSDRQYVFGLGLIVGLNEDVVIETLTQSQTKLADWLPLDGAFGSEFSGDITAISDDTPFLASSDFIETWPLDENGARAWPGPFRIDTGHDDYPDSLVEKLNEFTSDRDIFCLYNDDNNASFSGGVGLEVEQNAYSYGRPYAEDFVFWENYITNTSAAQLTDIYVGLFVKIRPDFDNHDYLNFIDSDGDGTKDLVYVYDVNNRLDRSWKEDTAPLGMVGIRIYDTPGAIGVTDFHHFPRSVDPSNDHEIWAIMTSDRELMTNNPDTTRLMDPNFYFHGSDRRLDSTDPDSLDQFYPPWEEEESGEVYGGDAVNYLLSCGPFTIAPGESVPFSFGLIMGDAGTSSFAPDTSDLMSNVRTANLMHSLNFQGSGPPAPPVVQVVAGDRKATLAWSSEPSESSVDVLTEVKDFEGYKIFRSTNQGRTWGLPITNNRGIPVGFEPLATFDLVNDIAGDDPAFPQFLGTNSGLTHTYIDSNLTNGIEYWYCVTAYDGGTQDPDSLEQSYMYPLGSSIFESHTVSVIPGKQASDLIAGQIDSRELEPIGGICEGTAAVELIDPVALTGHTYEITFAKSADDEIVFTLVDTNDDDTLYYLHRLSDATGDNIPVIDGFRLTLQNTVPGIASAGWTSVAGDTCTFDWRFASIDPNAGPQLVQAAIESADDWRITVDLAPSGGVMANWFDAFGGDIYPEKTHLPLKVEVINDPANPVDVSEHTWLNEFAIPATDPYVSNPAREQYYSPPGWDLVPGGRGYLSASLGWYEKHVDFIELARYEIDPDTNDSTFLYIRMFTNNKPDSSFNRAGELEIIDAKAPSDGDQFTIITRKPFRPSISYKFSTAAQAVATGEDSVDVHPLANVRVVPDPYVVNNVWETTEFGKKIQFNGLPSECTIKIYTLAGDYVRLIEHPDLETSFVGAGYAFWDLRNQNDQFIAPGVYIYAISTPEGHKKMGRFLVIR